MDQTAVVILNWNGLHFLKKFLPGVVEHSSANARVWVIDNDSEDDSVAWLKQHHPEVGLVVNEENYGFAEGYNQGLHHIEAEWYVLLNSDVKVTANWIPPVMDTIRQRDLSVCQPKILSKAKPDQFEHAGAAGGFIDTYGYPFCRGRILWEVENDKGQYATDEEIFWASGACMFIKSELFHKLGGLDEHFFAHMEEIDLCWRIKNRGHRIGYSHQSTVYHVGGGTLDVLSPFKTYLNFRNNLYMLVKNDHRPGFTSRILWRMTLDGVAAFRFLTEAKFSSFWAVFKAHMSFYRQLGIMRKKRKFEKEHATLPNLRGLYNRSIVSQFFLKGKKKFSDLQGEDFTA